MMLIRPWTLIVLSACAIMTASCAALRPLSPVAPPRLILAEAATQPCELAVLPERPTAADLDAAYVRRGAQVTAARLVDDEGTRGADLPVDVETGSRVALRVEVDDERAQPGGPRGRDEPEGDGRLAHTTLEVPDINDLSLCI